MKNVLLICRKELRSYFASPIAYAVMAIFGLIFGWVFFNASRDFVRFTLLQSQEGGGPVSVNDSIIRPLLGFAGTIGLFLIPMITMRVFAEEKRTGTIELLLTSPVKDIEIILGKWLGAVALYACVLLMSILNRRCCSRGASPISSRCWSDTSACCCRAGACWPLARSSPP
jgi:ABC-2 type transport system permease protein